MVVLWCINISISGSIIVSVVICTDILQIRAAMYNTTVFKALCASLVAKLYIKGMVQTPYVEA